MLIEKLVQLVVYLFFVSQIVLFAVVGISHSSVFATKEGPQTRPALTAND